MVMHYSCTLISKTGIPPYISITDRFIDHRYWKFFVSLNLTVVLFTKVTLIAIQEEWQKNTGPQDNIGSRVDEN